MSGFGCIFRLGPHWIPILIALLFPVTFITTYLIAVYLGHVEPGLPYISDTGTKAPESCIFGQLLNICAILCAICLYVRYRQVVEYNRFDHFLLRLNRVSFPIGLLSCLGMSLVANFQETSVLAVHFVGAFMAFGLGNVYCWIMALMTNRMYPTHNGRGIAYFRLVISFLGSLFFILTVTAGEMARRQFNGTSVQRWEPNDGGFVPHVVSTSAEWVVALLLLLYLTSFVTDFSKLMVQMPTVQLHVDHLAFSITNENSNVSSQAFITPGRNQQPITLQI